MVMPFLHSQFGMTNFLAQQSVFYNGKAAIKIGTDPVRGYSLLTKFSIVSIIEVGEDATDRSSVALFVGLCNLKLKSKPSGLPDSNVIFFVATKKTKQKKAWRCAEHVLLGMFLVVNVSGMRL
jgi:hypothetical protein